MEEGDRTLSRRQTPRKYWCFTINNPDALLDFEGLPVNYAVYQMEISSTGTNHFQGYLELQSKMRLNTIRNKFPGFETAHLEVRRGTAMEARDYSMKEDTRIDGPWEYGHFDPQYSGRRNDLEAVRLMLDNNNTDKEVADAHFGSWVRYHRSFTVYRSLQSEQRSWRTDATLLIGNPGTGKSYWAEQMCPGAYWKQPGSDWWDDYRGEEVVIMDEFTGWIPYNSLLRVLDAFPLLVQCKGGQISFRSKWVLLTANKLPTTWYSAEVFRKNDIGALLRRITKVLLFQGTPGQEDHRITQFSSYQEFIDSMEYSEWVAENVLRQSNF